MKLRIRNNSVRIRVTRSEVACLIEGKRVEQATLFSPLSSLISSIEASTGVAVPTATFDGRRVALSIPLWQIQQWAQSDQVSIEASQTIGSNTTLQLLVEKDFECLHSRAEGDDDAYPNPRRSESSLMHGVSR